MISKIKNYEIQNSFEKGDKGEEFCKFFLETGKYKRKIEYITDKLEQATLGDFRVTNYKGETSLIEVKSDYARTPNLFLETISNTNKNSVGCFLKSQADYLFYVRFNSRELYILPLESTRNWFIKEVIAGRMTNRRRETSTLDKGKVSYKTIGFAVDANNILRNVKGSSKMYIPDEFKLFEDNKK
jgi:hypothetical protein